MKSAKELIEELNRIDEHQKLEAKSGLGKSFLETVCSFANEPEMGGGTILVGVKKLDDDTLFPSYSAVGVDNLDKITSDIASQCASVFNVPIRPNIRCENVDGKNLLIAEIPEVSNSEKPVYIKNTGLPQGAFRRIGSTDQRCSDDDLSCLFNNRGNKTYDEAIIQGAKMSDIDPEAIEYYRFLRKRVNPTAEELLWNDEELLESLSAIIRDGNELKPTLAGILIFGNRKALRRLLPMVRVDYIRVQGKEWVENPNERFSTVDMRGSLLQLVQRVQDQIFEDLPKAFLLEEGDVQAKSQSLPSRVLREAIVNALMHASYREHQPIQIIRYNNRIEIRNSGYSLKNQDQLGEAGSKTRNPKIAAIFHETNLAETKGSGIRTMRRLMEENNFAPPTFESNRDNNNFTARLLLHHFLSKEDMDWLANFNNDNLNDAQKRALIFVRESGAIDNQTYRQINASDTLSSSIDLRRLRSSNLLEKKGQGSTTYYIAGNKMQIDKSTNTQQLESKTHNLLSDTHQLTNDTHQLTNDTHKLNLPNDVIKKLKTLGKNPRKDTTKSIVLELCAHKEMSAEEITKALNKSDKIHLVRTFLKPMVNEGLLKYTNDMVNHPNQKYKAVRTNNDPSKK